MRTPRSSFRRFQKLWTASPAPASKGRASANSATTKMRRRRCRPAPVPAWPPSLRASPGLTREAYQAGMLPNNSPHRVVTANMTNRIGRFRPQVGLRGKCPVGHARWLPAAWRIQLPNPAIRQQEPASRSQLIAGRKPSHGVAPNAIRTAISFCAVMPLASRRLAIFTQAISSTKPTAPSRSQKILRCSLGKSHF